MFYVLFYDFSQFFFFFLSISMKKHMHKLIGWLTKQCSTIFHLANIAIFWKCCICPTDHFPMLMHTFNVLLYFQRHLIYTTHIKQTLFQCINSTLRKRLKQTYRKRINRASCHLKLMISNGHNLHQQLLCSHTLYGNRYVNTIRFDFCLIWLTNWS